MKNIVPRITSLILVTFALTIVVAGQKREVPKSEFEFLVARAILKAENTYPRILTTIHGKLTKYESTSITKYEASDRTYNKISRSTSTGSFTLESVFYEGTNYGRKDGGVWENVVRPDVEFINNGFAIRKTIYTVETKSDGNASYSLLAKQEEDVLGAIYLWWSKIDSAGRLIEYSKKGFGDHSGKYEFPEKFDPIKVPKLGTKEDI